MNGMETGSEIASLAALLEFENHPSLLEFVCPSTGVLLWPAIRNQVIRLMMSDWVYTTQPLVQVHGRLGLARSAGVAVRAVVHNLTRPARPARVLMYATGAGLIEREGSYFNRYTGYFSEALRGDTWSVEGIPFDTWPMPRIDNRVSFSTPAKTWAFLRAKLALGSSEIRQATELVTLAERRAQQVLGWRLGNARRSWLIRFCARQLASYPLRRRNLEVWLRRVRPRLLLTEEGCYGHMAVLNATAREYGIPVAEFQHGITTSGHIAYNVAPVLATNAKYRDTQPNYFLAYGSWWNAQFNAPVSKVVVGNPHRSALLERRERPRVEAAPLVLVLGDGIETDLYIALCRELGELLPAPFKVVFRPHPLERDRVLAGRCTKFGRVAIDQGRDIYPSLFKSHVVVSEVSTGLFEAAGLVERIFVWNTPKSRFSLPGHPFAHFGTATELANAIQTTSAGFIRDSMQKSLWAPNWRARFTRFTDSVINGNQDTETRLYCE
ncbi:glycosyltransferase family protein [Nitrococcus mobilis]|nr:hypothetical protein [Nitrococcus mobilis]